MASLSNLDKKTRERVRELIISNLRGREELYAAAAVVDASERKDVCKRLAEDLAGHAAYLEQIVIAQGGSAITQEELADITCEVMFEELKGEKGSAGVLDEAEKAEQTVLSDYEEVVGELPEGEAKAQLEQQKQQVRFGKQVLHSMSMKTEGKNGGDV